MYKRVTHLDKKTANYKIIIDRYFVNGKIILEVDDMCLTSGLHEYVNISGKYYFVDQVVIYPELLIQELHIHESKKPSPEINSSY